VPRLQITTDDADRLWEPETVARRALMFSRVDLTTHRALVNGAAGMVAPRDGRPFSVAAITVRNGRIAELDFLADPARLAALDLTVLDTSG